MDAKTQDAAQSPQIKSPEIISTAMFTGIPSGDHESFCWDVSAETFTQVTGSPPESDDNSFFNKGMYRLYPNALMPNPNGQDSRSYKFSMQVEQLPEGQGKGQTTSEAGDIKDLSLPPVE